MPSDWYVKNAPHEFMIDLRNWYCPKCRTWLAACDMFEDRTHMTCKTKCQWLKFVPEIFQVLESNQWTSQG